MASGICATVPLTPAGTELISFMVSTIPTTVSGSTWLPTLYGSTDPTKTHSFGTNYAAFSNKKVDQQMDAIQKEPLADQPGVRAGQRARRAVVGNGQIGRDHQAGDRHLMTGAQFTALATAIMTFIVAIEEARQTALDGAAWSPPPAAVTIA